MGSATEAGGPAGPNRPWRRAEGWLLVALVVALVATVSSGVVIGLHAEVGNPSSAAASTPPPVAPLQVLATTPVTKASGIAPDATVTVDLSTPLSAASPLPTFSPPVAGAWSSLSPEVLEFSADGPFVPGTTETLVIPGGPNGLLAADGQRLAASASVTFSVAPGSTLRLQQLLAQLGYLPVAFSPATQPASPAQEADVQQGTFDWRWSGLPSSLTSQWAPGTYGVITKGAVMRFETTHTMAVDGLAGPQVWAALLAAASSGAGDPDPYDYVDVTKTLPETVTVYENGAVAYTTLANTGVASVATTTGTFPVFEHLASATMTGTNPTGSHYVDPGIPWVSYFNGGDALHGYVRASYGFPQSDGCVEMPPSNAAVVWPLTPLGTLVTVQ
jgi:peptidoglycan hydrolase-like protein with peptidoglycan-binding domain